MDRIDRVEIPNQLYRTLSQERGVSFINNDYLGLSHHPDILAIMDNAKMCGAGSRGSRLLGGNHPVFEELESALCDYFKAPAALFFSSGYLANLAITTVIAPLFDRVFSDEKNHASLIDGLRLAKAKKVIVPHLKWSGVAATQDDLLVTESLFSMDGDCVDVSQLKCGFVILDEAHAAGVFPEDGLGFMQGLSKDRCAATVTFGKAFGVAGACILCSPKVKELLINLARPFIYSTAPPPIVPLMVMESLKVLSREPWRREALWERAIQAREILSEVREELAPHRLSDWNAKSPIISFSVRLADRALRFSQSMRESGFELRAIRSPTVPEGEERLRVSLTLNVSEENTRAMALEMVRQWKAFS